MSGDAMPAGAAASVVAAGVAAAAAVLFVVPFSRTTFRTGTASPLVSPSPTRRGWLVRYRVPVCVLAGVGAATQLQGPLMPLVAVGVGTGLWFAIARIEPPGVRAEREAARRDLVPIIELFAAALTAGSPTGRALDIACQSLPGAAADRLRIVRAQLALGADPERSWNAAVDDEVLAQLARSMARAQRTGAPIAGAISRLAEDLAAQQRARVEERARAVGVKAALPLGLCLLPAFLLLGIVPVAASLLSGIA